MSDAKNIFLTYENLAFSLPLLLVVSVYLYFKFVPTKIALSLIGGLLVLLFLRKQVKVQKDKKLTKLDERSIRELVGEADGGDSTAAAASKAKKQQLKKQRKSVKARLAQEQASAGHGVVDEDEHDEDDLGVFAKPKSKQR